MMEHGRKGEKWRGYGKENLSHRTMTALELRSGAVVQFELASENDDGSCEGKQDCNRRGGLCIMNGGDVTANMSSEGSLLYCTSNYPSQIPFW